MPAFLYRCPFKELNVQGWVANDPDEYDDDTYVPVTCLVCGRVHWVNPPTGNVKHVDDE